MCHNIPNKERGEWYSKCGEKGREMECVKKAEGEEERKGLYLRGCIIDRGTRR